MVAIDTFARYPCTLRPQTAILRPWLQLDRLVIQTNGAPYTPEITSCDASNEVGCGQSTGECNPPLPAPRQDESEDGYQRQYAIVALASEMAAGSVVASHTRKPDAEESKEMVRLLEAINKELKNVMQETVTLVRTLVEVRHAVPVHFIREAARVPPYKSRRPPLSFHGLVPPTAGGPYPPNVRGLTCPRETPIQSCQRRAMRHQ